MDNRTESETLMITQVSQLCAALSRDTDVESKQGQAFFTVNYMMDVHQRRVISKKSLEVMRRSAPADNAVKGNLVCFVNPAQPNSR